MRREVAAQQEAAARPASGPAPRKSMAAKQSECALSAPATAKTSDLKTNELIIPGLVQSQHETHQARGA
jgi:hypothetical protein